MDWFDKIARRVRQPTTLRDRSAAVQVPPREAIPDYEDCPVQPNDILQALVFGQFGRSKKGRVWCPSPDVEVVMDTNGRGFVVWKSGYGWKFRLKPQMLCHGPMLRSGEGMKAGTSKKPVEPRPAPVQGTKQDAVSALINLGWRASTSRKAIDKALETLGPGQWPLEKVVKAGLKEARTV